MGDFSASKHSDMLYVSTRGSAAPVSFEDALLAGLAPDGGLYMPMSWPSLPALPSVSRAGYPEVAARIISLYTGGNPGYSELRDLVSAAYAGFNHLDVAPLRQVRDGLYLLELFHGPTLAFKDFAMQVLSRLMERALSRRGLKTTIIGATSGDTGAAAVEAFRGRRDIELFILFPYGRISDVQRRQMTTAVEENVHAIAVDGTFDDAQAIVKTLLSDAAFRSRHALSAINSINWARIVAQIVYYVTAGAKLGTAVQPGFVVPTGNFGDIFAGFAASLMGLSMTKLVIATNENDILARALASGRYEPRGVTPTDSPSMDIQISSNFERLLFEEGDRNASLVVTAMETLSRSGGFDIPSQTLARIRERFSARRVNSDERAAAMRGLFEETGILIDPHTAVGVVAAERDPTSGSEPTVVLATAHPAKFPESVKRATGRAPECPPLLQRCLGRAERFTRLPNSAASVAAYIDAKAATGVGRKHQI